MEHAAGLAGHEVDFQTLFLEQDEDDEELASLADVLGVLAAAYPREFLAKDVAELVNSYWSGSDEEKSNKKLVRDFLLPGATNDHVFSAKSIGRLLKKHLDNVVITETGGMLVLRKREGYAKAGFYHVDRCAIGTASTLDPGETGEDGANQEAGEVATASQDPDGQNTTKTRTGVPPSGDDGDDPDVAELLNLPKGQPARGGS